MQSDRQILEAAHRWRQLLTSDDATADDRARFEAWLEADPRHQEAYGKAVTFWASFDHLPEGAIEKDNLTPTLRERIVKFSGRMASKRFATPTPYAAAAAFLLVAFVGAYAFLHTRAPGPASDQVVFVATDLGRARDVALPDGTKLVLSSKSQVSFAQTEDERRAILISGSAFFDVAHNADRPFIVVASAGVARVLGTRFTVSRDADVFRVAVAEGRVEVQSARTGAARDRVLLKAGEQAAASPTRPEIEKSAIAPEDVGAWRAGRLVFDGTSLKEVFAIADRYAAASIVIDETNGPIEAFGVSGSFRTDNIDDMLDALALLHPLEIDRNEPGEIVVRATPVD